MTHWYFWAGWMMVAAFCFALAIKQIYHASTGRPLYDQVNVHLRLAGVFALLAIASDLIAQNFR